MATWLDDATVRSVIGADLADAIPPNALAPWAKAAADYIESRRPDLYVDTNNDGVPDVFTPGDDVLAGSALLAYRWYKRRTSPLGVNVGSDGEIMRHDPDIAKLCGIGPARRGVVFGGVDVTS